MGAGGAALCRCELLPLVVYRQSLVLALWGGSRGSRGLLSGVGLWDFFKASFDTQNAVVLDLLKLKRELISKRQNCTVIIIK